MTVAARLIQSVQQKALSYGFDICTPFSLSTYNKCVDEKLKRNPFNIEKTEGVDPVICFMLGNSRYAWPHMLQYFHKYSDNGLIANPVDTWAKDSITSIVADVANDFQKETLDLNNKFFLDDDGSVQHPAIYHSFETGGNRLIAMQRLAHAIGVGFYDSTFYTVVHEKFGPWVSLRGVLMYDIGLLGSSVEEEINSIKPLLGDGTIVSPCLSHHCLPQHTIAFNELMAGKKGTEVLSSIHAALAPEDASFVASCQTIPDTLSKPDVLDVSLASLSGQQSNVSQTLEGDILKFKPLDVHELSNVNWEAGSLRWLLNRAVCDVGLEYRFPPAMALYHYSHDRAALQAEIDNFQSHITNLNK